MIGRKCFFFRVHSIFIPVALRIFYSGLLNFRCILSKERFVVWYNIFPIMRKWINIFFHIFFYLTIYLSIYLSLHQPVCPYICLFVCISVCLSFFLSLLFFSFSLIFCLHFFLSFLICPLFEIFCIIKFIYHFVYWSWFCQKCDNRSTICKYDTCTLFRRSDDTPKQA